MSGQAEGATTAMRRADPGGMLRAKRSASVLAGLLSVAIVLAPIAPASAAAVAQDQGPMLCQTLADGYEAQRAEDPALPALFDAPFSFEGMDWADDAGAKAVNVLKQQDFFSSPGMTGAFFCLPDGMIKQVVTCAETGETDAETPALERFRRVAGAFLETIGASDDARSSFAGAVDAASGVGDTKVSPLGSFVMLVGPIYAFITGEDGAVCMTISQTTKTDAQ